MPIDGCEWRRLDMSAPAPAVIEEVASCHSLLHLAWGGLPNYQERRHIAEELPQQRHFISEVCKAGQRSIVVTGTCFEYGLQEGELCEDMSPQPNTSYAVAKDLLRQHCQAIADELNVRLSWPRLFYVYGPGQSAKSLWSQLQAAISRGDTKFPMSAGQQVRDFIRIEEAAGVLARMAIARIDAKVVNVCSGDPATVEQRVRRWLDESGVHMELELGKYPYPSHEPFRFWGARTRLDSLGLSRTQNE
jgi:nucleoside-diphosphate-sugar epimerase